MFLLKACKWRTRVTSRCTKAVAEGPSVAPDSQRGWLSCMSARVFGTTSAFVSSLCNSISFNFLGVLCAQSTSTTMAKSMATTTTTTVMAACNNWRDGRRHQQHRASAQRKLKMKATQIGHTADRRHLKGCDTQTTQQSEEENTRA